MQLELLYDDDEEKAKNRMRNERKMKKNGPLTKRVK
jgi:hypothetical protein